MAFKKTANAEVADLISLKNWEQIHGQQSFQHKTASSINKFAAKQSRYLLSHCTIVASVAVEDPPLDHLIKPQSAAFVNANFDSWSLPVLQLSYRTFCGSFVFVEHFQNSKKNKGHVLDAVLRRVKIAEDVVIGYVDILVAVDLAHTELVEGIRSGENRYLSMGCVCQVCLCSYCGARSVDATSFCPHLMYSKGDFLFDESGVPRIVAELCGHPSLPNGGVTFLEASFVKTPAFFGASKRSIIMDEWVGPASPYTHVASQGMKKAASTIAVCTPAMQARFESAFKSQFSKK